MPIGALLCERSGPCAAPRWPVLLALTLTVSAVHGWLLLALSGNMPDVSRPPSERVWRVDLTPATTRAATPVGRLPGPEYNAHPNYNARPGGAPSHAATHTRARHGPAQVAARRASPVPAPIPTQGPEAAARPNPIRASGAASASAAATAAAAPIRLPPAVTLHYRVVSTRRGEPARGVATLVWSPEGDRYRAAWELASPLGARSQTSEGALRAGGLAPERYGDRRGYGGRRGSERAAHFDPAGRRVRFSANTPDAPWQPGMQDRLSALLQLAALLAGAPERFPAGSRIGLPTAGATSAADDVWQVVGEEALDIDGQPMPCLHLRRDAADPYDDRTDLWLAPDRDYLPARWLITHFNGDTVEQTLDGR